MSITLRSRRGPIGVGWHAVALRSVIEPSLGSSRASGGRADARAGRVAWIDISRGTARGAVQDADGELYRPQLDLPPFSPADRQAYLSVARAVPGLPAMMAAGTYPEQVEREAAASEVSLLPRGASGMSHDCSCLDWPGPCRHVAALAYVLVEAVDEHPLHLLTLRGLRIEDLVAPGNARPVPEGERTGAGSVGPDAGPGTPGPGTPGTGTPEAGTPSDGDARTDGGESDGGAPGGGVSDSGGRARSSDPVDAPGRPSPGFDPARADPAVLSAVLGEHAAAVIAAFYRQGSAGGASGNPSA